MPTKRTKPAADQPAMDAIARGVAAKKINKGVNSATGLPHTKAFVSALPAVKKKTKKASA